MNTTTSTPCTPTHPSISYHIPSYARFQWLNHPVVRTTLSRFLQPPKVERKGYDKVGMFLWLMHKQLMRCSYRDLESMTGIDYSTLIKFGKGLIQRLWFPRIFRTLVSQLISPLPSLLCILDSSFVESYSRKKEEDAEYSGFKQRIGFKLHQNIDFHTRLPPKQSCTGGARSDIVLGGNLIRGSPKHWRVKALAADKGYDGAFFVHEIYQRWKGIQIAIPLRRTNQEALGAKRRETEKSRALKAAERTLTPELLDKRTEIERYFSRKKRVFRLGEERARGFKNFRANSSLTSLVEILEFLSKNTPSGRYMEGIIPKLGNAKT